MLTSDASAKRPDQTIAVTASENGLKRSEWAIVVLFIASNLFVGITFACIVPFFSIEAQSKGLSTSQVGLVIGIFQLSNFFVSPIIGKYMVILRINRTFIGGLCLTSLCTIALGVSPLLPSGMPFFVGVLILRMGQSIGNASYSTSAWAFIGQMFPERIVTFSGLFEVAYGLGFTLGPAFGSALYEIGGFGLPLYSVGLSFAFVVVLAVVLFQWNSPTGNGDSNGNGRSDIAAAAEELPRAFKLLFIPDLFLTITFIFLNSVCWHFYEPSLTDFMATFHHKWSSPSVMSGFLLSLVAVVYIISSSVCSFVLQRYLGDQMRPMMLISVGSAVATLLMGPSPLLGLPKSFLISTFAFALFGFVLGFAYVPVFKWCIDAAKKKGLNGTSTGTCGCISSFIQSAISLGAFLSTSLGGLSAQHLGFPWTATLVAFIQMAFIIVQIVYWLPKRNSSRNDSIHPNA